MNNVRFPECVAAGLLFESAIGARSDVVLHINAATDQVLKLRVIP